MHRIRPTPSVLDIAARLEEAGFEAWCVGGALRDALLGGEPLDWDLATDATPDKVRDIFGRKRTIPIGIEFGTVSVLDGDGIPHEITTFRRDVRTDGRHAQVEFGANLDDDLARRDFTINAIAFRPRTSEVRDPFDGRLDLERRIVRAVGNPDERMREDRLRALRGIRFAARYGFTIDPPTRDAIAASAPHLTRLSAERVQQELTKTMQQVDSPGSALRLWHETGALAVLIPPLATMDEVAFTTLDKLPRDGANGRTVAQRTSNRIAALFLAVPAQVTRTTLPALRFSKQDINWATALIERWDSPGQEITRSHASAPPTDAQVRRWLGQLGRVHVRGFFRVAEARWSALREMGLDAPSAADVRALYRRMLGACYADPIEIADLAIGGEELRQAGIPAGPIYAKILHELLEVVLEAPARNTPEALLEELPAVVARVRDRTNITSRT